MKTEPTRQHAWLQKLVGDWVYEHHTNMPNSPSGQCPASSTGTERVRAMGDLWIVAEGQGKMPDGSPATWMMTLGYDPQKGRFIGTWVGSMMTHLWMYDGQLDSAERLLTLTSEGPAMDNMSSHGKYQDIIEIKTDDHRMMSSRTQTPDGQWNTFMTAHYRRGK